MPVFVLAFGLIAIILIVTALAYGLIERSPLSFPLIFLGFGFVLGGGGLSLINMGPHDTTLEVVTTLTLSLVLFLDAAKLQLEKLGKRWLAPALVLGPGTGLIVALGAVPLALLLDLTGWSPSSAAPSWHPQTRPYCVRSCATGASLAWSDRCSASRLG